MKKITFFLVLICSFTTWSQNSSGAGTSQSGTGGGTGITVSICSTLNSDSIEILPSVLDANVIGYKIYSSNLELRRDVSIQPVNNQIIKVVDLPKGQYYIHLFLDKEINATTVIDKQFIKQ